MAGFTIDSVLYGPYGREEFFKHKYDIIKSLLTSTVLVALAGVTLPHMVHIAEKTDTDDVSRAMFIGIISACIVYYGHCLPTTGAVLPNVEYPGAACSYFLRGRIGLPLMYAYVAAGFLGSFVAAALTHTLGWPVVVPAFTESMSTLACIQVIHTGVFAFVAMKDPPLACAAVSFLLVAGSYLKWKLWCFNAYVYFAAGYASAFGGNVTVFATPVPGTWIILIYADIIGWVTALLIDAILYRVLKKKPKVD